MSEPRPTFKEQLTPDAFAEILLDRALLAEADAKRLNWLEAWHTTRDREFANGDSGINLIDRVSDGWMVDGELMPNAHRADRTFDTLREAIDAARSVTQARKD